MVALPSAHPAARQGQIDLTDLADDPLLLFPREVGPTLYDAIVGAFREAGVEPRMGQTAPQISSVVNFVATSLGISLVPASMSQLSVAGVVYRAISGNAPVAKIAVASRKGETSIIIRNFIARAFS
jgi:DNA-binding transcriptional LysR family regulator